MLGQAYMRIDKHILYIGDNVRGRGFACWPIVCNYHFLYTINFVWNWTAMHIEYICMIFMCAHAYT